MSLVLNDNSAMDTEAPLIEEGGISARPSTPTVELGSKRDRSQVSYSPLKNLSPLSKRQKEQSIGEHSADKKALEIIPLGGLLPSSKIEIGTGQSQHVTTTSAAGPSDSNSAARAAGTQAQQEPSPAKDASQPSSVQQPSKLDSLFNSLSSQKKPRRKK